MKVSDDRADLVRHIKVPESLQHVRWAARPRGQGDSPGPTDLELVAFFPLDEAAWDAVEPALGAPTGQVDATVSGDLLAASWGQPGGVDRSPVKVVGTNYRAAAFENVFWVGSAVVRTPDGLLVCMVSR